MWVEHPIVTQLAFALSRVFVLAPENPKWKDTEPFKSILARDKAAIAKFTMQDLEAILMATHAGMATGDFHAIVSDWITEGQGPEVESALHRARLPTHARGNAVSAG